MPSRNVVNDNSCSEFTLTEFFIAVIPDEWSGGTIRGRTTV